MSKFVLDSSYVLAVILEERLHSNAMEFLVGSTMSAVNYAEVWTKLHQMESMNDMRVEAVFGLLREIVPFTLDQSRKTAELYKETKHAGLSLGDRACLALALATGSAVVTADRAWANVDVGCRVRLVR